MNSNILAHPAVKASAGGDLDLPLPPAIKRLLNLFNRPDVSNTSMSLHNQALEQVRRLAIILKSCYQKQFDEGDFLYFVKLRNNFARGRGEFEGLKDSLRLFRAAVEAKNSFLKIEKIESMYGGSKQQEFYDSILKLLAKNVSKFDFYKQVNRQFHEIIDSLETESSQKALKSYMIALDTLSKQDRLGLKLLYLFKKLKLTNYSILKTVSDLVNNLQYRDIQDLDSIVKLVKANHDVFLKLGRIIGIPFVRNNPQTYAMMLQYVVLRQKYRTLYYQFKKVKKLLCQWYCFYRIVSDIRVQYPFLEYRQPKEFKEYIPGLDIYEKYKNYLK